MSFAYYRNIGNDNNGDDVENGDVNNDNWERSDSPISTTSRTGLISSAVPTSFLHCIYRVFFIRVVILYEIYETSRFINFI